MFSLLKEPIKYFFHFLRVFLISSISFGSYFEFLSLCLHCPSVSHRVLSIVIIVVLNSQSNNSNIPVRSSSDAGSVSTNCAFCLLVYLVVGEGNGIPLQYSCLENPMDGGAWWAAIHGVAKSRTRLRDFTFTFHFHALEKEMAAHSSVLAWRIPGTGEPGGLPSMGSPRVRHNWSDLA